MKTRIELSNCVAHKISNGIGSFLNLRTLLILLKSLMSEKTRKDPTKDELSIVLNARRQKQQDRLP